MDYNLSLPQSLSALWCKTSDAHNLALGRNGYAENAYASFRLRMRGRETGLWARWRARDRAIEIKMANVQINRKLIRD